MLPFTFLSNTIRVVEIDGQPWFLLQMPAAFSACPTLQSQ
jgi:prophage antirepressor-like protein